MLLSDLALADLITYTVWLLRNDAESFDGLLQQFLALPQTADVQASL